MYELISTHAQKKTNIIILFKFSETDTMWWYIPQDLFYSNTRATFFFVALCFFFQLNWHRNAPLIWYIVLFTSRDQSLVAGGAAKLYEKDGETLGYSVLFLKILFSFFFLASDVMIKVSQPTWTKLCTNCCKTFCSEWVTNQTKKKINIFLCCVIGLPQNNI